MIKTGVIGVGHLGSSHTRVYNELKGCRLVGVYDIDQPKSDRIAGKFNVGSFDNLASLINECDAVSIATPTTSHFEIGMEAVEAGKHILVEKPMTTTIEQAQRLIKRAEAKGVILQVGHIERFNPAFLSASAFVKKPLFIESHRLTRFGGRGIEVDVILDLMIHDIDLILAMVNEEPSEIRCAGAPVLTDSSDIANVRLEFPSGCTANVTASRISTHPMRKMRIFQKAGYISIDFAERKSEIYLLKENRDEDSELKPAFSIPSGLDGKIIDVFSPEVKEVDMLEEEIGGFISSINNKTAPPVDGHAGLRALRVATQIVERLPRIPE